MAYYKRQIDNELLLWKESPLRKPLLIRGARQVGKSSAVQTLGKTFQYYVEINLEKQPSLKALFTEDVDVHKTCERLSAAVSTPIIPSQTLLFIDEIQNCKPAIMSLRYFKENYPELHVIAAGSLLEFTLNEIPSFAVGRIRSLYMYPFSFDEFLTAQGLDLQLEAKRKATADEPLFEALHRLLCDQLRTFFLVGGMPEAVSNWIEKHDHISVQRIHRDILDTYQDDFAKYKKRVSTDLLRQVLKSVALQAGSKFVVSQVATDMSAYKVKEALRLLGLAGLAIPVTRSDANGLPLGAEADTSYQKYLFLDIGLMLTLLSTPATDILLTDDTDIINKGSVSEVFAGLELVKYSDCFQKPELYFWLNKSKNANAEVDYLLPRAGKVLPVEVKAGTKGSMQSLYLFMAKKGLVKAVRTSMENFQQYEYNDTINTAIRQINVVPLYALSNL